MRVVVFGGTGFVGLNIAEAFGAAGHAVALFDRDPPPAAFAEPVAFRRGDVRDPDAVAAAVPPGTDLVILGAAVTADAAREAREPDAILAVNLGALPAILAAARDAGVRRVVNLSSAAAYGAAPAAVEALDEAMPADPVGLYAVTKFASERVVARLCGLWGLEAASLRLSAVFGPWERATGVRDTLSPQAQMMAAAREGRPALLPRPGLRDWIYAPDAAAAVLALAAAPRWAHGLYNVSTGARWSALGWGEALACHWPGFLCRLAGSGERPTVDLHAEADRPSLATGRLAADAGWAPRFDRDGSAEHFAAWWAARDEKAAA